MPGHLYPCPGTVISCTALQIPSVTVAVIFESAKLRPLVDMPRPGGSVTGLRPVSLVVIHRYSDLPGLPKKSVRQPSRKELIKVREKKIFINILKVKIMEAKAVSNANVSLALIQQGALNPRKTFD